MVRKHAGHISSPTPYGELPRVPPGPAPGAIYRSGNKPVSELPKIPEGAVSISSVKTGEIVEWGTLNNRTKIVTSSPDEWSAKQLLSISNVGDYSAVYRLIKGSSVSIWMEG